MKKFTFKNDGIGSTDLKISDYNLDKLRKFAKTNIDFKNLFQSKKLFKRLKNHKGVNPRPGMNLAEKAQTNFFFSNKNLVAILNNLLGEGWRVLDYKFVVALPDKFIPKWVLDECKDLPIPNLGAYLKPKNRNCTFFRGIDFHQDIIDFKNRGPDFITFYLYLDNVSESDAPLIILPKSHKLQAQIFPHKISELSKQTLGFEDKRGNIQKFEKISLTNKKGSAYYWHPYIMHGTNQSKNIRPRISLRVLFDKNSHKNKNCLLDKINQKLGTVNLLSETRSDRDKNHFVFEKEIF